MALITTSRSNLSNNANNNTTTCSSSTHLNSSFNCNPIEEPIINPNNSLNRRSDVSSEKSLHNIEDYDDEEDLYYDEDEDFSSSENSNQSSAATPSIVTPNLSSRGGSTPTAVTFNNNLRPHPYALVPRQNDLRRDHHNQLERRRRVMIKSCFEELRSILPLNSGLGPSLSPCVSSNCSSSSSSNSANTTPMATPSASSKSSRALILQNAAMELQMLERDNSARQESIQQCTEKIGDLSTENHQLMMQINHLRARLQLCSGGEDEYELSCRGLEPGSVRGDFVRPTLLAVEDVEDEEEEEEEEEPHNHLVTRLLNEEGCLLGLASVSSGSSSFSLEGGENSRQLGEVVSRNSLVAATSVSSQTL